MNNNTTNVQKKIAIIGMTGLPARYGGWDKLVEYMTINLKKDFHFLVYCSAFLYPNKINDYNGTALKYIYLRATGVQSIMYDIVCMLHAIKNVDILVILGVSGCTFLPIIRLLSAKKIVVNIDGIEWKRGKWGMFTKYFLKLSEKMAVRYSDVIIADNMEIYKYIESEYNVKAELISYGGDHVINISLNDPDVIHLVDKYSFIHNNYTFSVCRIEPENNIAEILKVFSDSPHQNLVIVGNWKYSNYGRTLKSRYSNFPNIFLYNPIYEQKHLDLLRSNAFYYVHGHSVGGTNPALVEAMSLGLNIIAYDVGYNKETTEGKAIYFVSSEELYEIINSDLNKFDNSGSMLEIAQRRYKWSIVSSKYKKVFNDLLY